MTPLTARLALSWRQAVAIAAALTEPRANLARSDAQFKAVLIESGVMRGAQWLMDAMSRAWRTSVACAILGHIERELSANAANAVRTTSLTILVAATIVLVINRIKPLPADPLSSLLPAACAAVAVVGCLAAAGLSRAIGDRRNARALHDPLS